VWSGFTWLRIGTVGGLLWMLWWTFGFWRHGVSLIALATEALVEQVQSSERRISSNSGLLWIFKKVSHATRSDCTKIGLIL
jgi:hypothetical protein